ncbi:recombinase family protein [Massiliimalia timonensis]|nr:recombinase family protein [Massiliimalia timonensis]
MPMVYGYHRTSTAEQHLDRGIASIESFCREHGLKLERIFTDQQTGKNFDRPRYKVMKEDVLRGGDTLIISELDRLGRNKNETLKELRYYKDQHIRVMILEIPTTLTDYSAYGNEMAAMIMETINDMLIQMYAVMAQAEVEKKEKRQREGIAAKKQRGDWEDYGRLRAVEMELFLQEYRKVEKGEIRPVDCMRNLGITKSTYYRYREAIHISGE